MRVVVTGASGNVGTSVIEALAQEPQVTEVIGIARRLPGMQAPKTTWVSVDVAVDDLVTHFRGADAVVHLAWLFQPTHKPMLTWEANALGSIRVFQAVAEVGVPALVHASSVGAYSPAPPDAVVGESWPTHALPTAAYGREKSYVERVLDAFEPEHPEVRVVRMRPAFIFKREYATEQRRLFMGPFVPGFLLQPRFVPVVPDLPGLRFQALHSADAAEAYRLAVTRPVSGPFNIAAEPVVDPAVLAELFGARAVKLPLRAVRAGLALAWHLHLVPAEPALLDLALSLPVMDTTRARTELGWIPRHSGVEAMQEMLEGLREGAGLHTPPLRAGRAGGRRAEELATGVGQRP